MKNKQNKQNKQVENEKLYIWTSRKEKPTVDKAIEILQNSISDGFPPSTRGDIEKDIMEEDAFSRGDNVYLIEVEIKIGKIQQVKQKIVEVDE